MPQARQKQLGSGIQHRVIHVSTADLVNAGTTKTIPIATLPDGAEVVSAWYDLKEVFTSGTISGVTCQIGCSDDTDAFVTAGQVLSGSPSLGRRHIKGAWTTASGKAVNALFTASGANFGDGTDSALSAGAIECHINFIVAK